MHTVLGAICSEWLLVIQPYIYSFAMFKEGDSRIDRYITPYAHPWFFMRPELASQLEDFRNGGRDFPYFLTKLPLWFPFIASWTVLVSLTGGAMLCINSLMRDQWNNREKLAFPIIQVPMEVVKIGGGTSKILKSPYFRYSFLGMAAIDLLNGAHFFYPNLPFVNVRFIGDLQQFFSVTAAQCDWLDTDWNFPLHGGHRLFHAHRPALFVSVFLLLSQIHSGFYLRNRLYG